MLARMTGGVGCPDENALVRFSMGQLSGTDLGGLEAHLDGCGACRSLIAQLSSGLTNLKQTGSLEAVADAPVMRHGKVGRYQVERLVGGGGMGMVYAARDKELNRAVAIKLLRTSALANAESRSRLLREAQTMAKLSHPNLVPIFELGSDHGDDFLAMELIDGPTLDMWLRERKRDWHAVVRIFIDAGRGLEAAHQAGVVHRDFKPGNVLVGPDGRARVTDFGLARPNVPLLGVGAEGGSIELTREGSLLGTPAYMAPEQLEGQVADVRSDQFSFCVALAEALTGHRPFPGRTLEELRTAMRSGKPPVFEVASPRLERALRKGMAVLPEARFESIGALLAELEIILKPSRANPRAIAAAMAFAVTLAAAAGVAWQQLKPVPTEAVVPIGAPIHRTVNVSMGEPKTLALNGVQRILHIDLNVLDAKTIGNQQVELTGVYPGRTTLVLETRSSPHEPVEQVEWEVVVTDDAQELRFLVGAEQSLTVPGVTRIVSNDPSVLELGAIQSTTFGLKALKVGTTRVTAFRGENSSPLQWKITVSAAPVPLLRATTGGTIRLAPKQQKTVTIPGLERIEVGDAAISAAKTVGINEVQLIGGKPGRTTLMAWTAALPPAGPKRLEYDIWVTVDPTDPPAISAGNISLRKGTQKVLTVPGIERIVVGDSAIADVKTIGNNQLLLMGGKVGATTLIVSSRPSPPAELTRLEYKISVTGWEAEPTEIVERKPLVLVIGTQKVLTVPGIQRVAVGDSAIADVKTIGNDQLLVIGTGEGTTTLLIWTSSGKRLEWDVSVVMTDPAPRVNGETITDNDGVERKSLKLFVGAQSVLEVPGIQRVAIGDSAIADVKTIGNNQLLVIGAGQGTTTLILWTAKGQRLEWDVVVEANPGTAPLPEDDSATVIELAVGAERALDIPALVRVAIGDAAIADVKTVGNNKLVVKGKRSGRTTLLVWSGPTASSRAQRTAWLIKVQ